MDLELRLLSWADRAEWAAEVERFGPLADVYFSAGYVHAYEENGDGLGRCAIVREGEASLVVPYLECALPGREDGFDVQGAYGYGGPLLQGPPDFVARAWAAIELAWSKAGAVAAFFRLHPLLDQRAWLGEGWTTVEDRKTLSVDLRQGATAAFASPRTGNHRNMVARARRAGLVVRREVLDDRRLEAFAGLYGETMLRLGAAESYQFGAPYFRSLATGLGSHLELFSAERSSGETEGMALAMWGPRWGHYHLSARAADADNCGTNLILQAVAEAAEARGLHALHLGGGRSPAPDDSLLRFKERIGTAQHSFRTARRILSPARYEDEIERWSRQQGRPPSWFLGYRQPA